MNDYFLNDSIPIFWPAVYLAIGFPVLLLVLNELIGLCVRKNWPIVKPLRTLRNFVAPSLAVLIFLRYILEQPSDSLWVRLAESVFWLMLLYTVLGIVNDILFGLGESDSWQRKVPKLFRDLAKALLVAIGAMVIYSKVWGYDFRGALTALGLGSVVIGLALQEPLGNIVSGFMLLMERPLNVGDHVDAGGHRGRVNEINWRSVHIETPTRELYIIPNVSLYKNPFSNLSRPSDVRTELVEVGFSYDDPPNKVKDVMMALMTSTPGILSDPGPLVRTVDYAAYSITYRLIFSVERQEVLGEVRDRLLTRLWYVAKREGLSIPFPIQMEYGPDESPGPLAPKASELIQDHARFKPAIKEGEGHQQWVIEYGKGETVQQKGKPFQGFALIVQGRAKLLTADLDGELVEIGEIGPGECFGDQVSTGSGDDDLGIVAIEDLKVIRFDGRDIEELLNRSPGLAAEIGDAIEARRQAAQGIKYRRKPV
jgi:small-conductance mechanosensitive channel